MNHLTLASGPRATRNILYLLGFCIIEAGDLYAPRLPERADRKFLPMGFSAQFAIWVFSLAFAIRLDEPVKRN